MSPSTNSEDPIREIERQLAKLRRRDDHLAESLSETREERRQVAAQIRALEANLQMLRQIAARAPSGDTMAIQAGTIADAAEVCLRQRGGSSRLVELVADLQVAGKLLRSEGAYATLFRALSRDQRFERAPGKRGWWRLADPRAESS
jgi:septal ring factor EnvC (AmiA/AmiB activator)